MDIKGFENYTIDTNGNVYSKYRKRYLIPQKSKDGYINVGLWNTIEKKQVRLRINRLVAITYLPNPNNLPQVNHKNCNKADNRLENLEWCNSIYNYQSINKTGNVGHIEKHRQKYRFGITTYGKNVRYYCPSENIAKVMREIFIDLL